MDEATWLALTAVLTALGGAWTWYAARHRGLASALRGAGLTLLPPAAFLTESLETVVEIGSSVADWATGLVLSPTVWAGIVLAGLAVVLLGASSALRSRELGRAERPDPTRRRSDEMAPGATPGAAVGATSGTAPGLPGRRTAGRGDPAVADDDLADIEALLRRRGIT